jgi:hypothetical protein
MSSKAQTQAKQGTGPLPSFTPAPSGLLQRACACGGQAGLGGTCTECQRQRLTGEQRPLVQAKLTVNRPGDRYEQEADRIADQVMRMPVPAVQRAMLPEEEKEDEEDESLQMKPLSAQITPLVQRETIPEEEEEEASQRQVLPEAEAEDEDHARAYIGPREVAFPGEPKEPASLSPRNWEPDAETLNRWRLEALMQGKRLEHMQPWELAREEFDRFLESIAVKWGVNPSLLKKAVRSVLKGLGKKAMNAAIKAIAPEPKVQDGLKKDLDGLWRERRRLEEKMDVGRAKLEALQRQPEKDEDKEELSQPTGPTAPSISPSADATIQGVRQDGGKPLDLATRTLMETRFGHDFGQVRVHTDTRAVAAAHAVRAMAFTIGRDVIFGAAQYAPTTLEGQRLLAHELAHVVQQEGAQQRAAMTEPGSTPEQEAARAADRVLRGEPAGYLKPAGIGPARYEPGQEEARDLIDYLLGMSNEAETFFEQFTDSRYLRVVRSELSARMESMDAPSPKLDELQKLHSLVMTRLSLIEAEGVFKDFKDDFEDLVRRIIRRTKGIRISPDDEEELRQLLGSLSVQNVKELEKMILLSPDVVGHSGKAAHIIEIVTSFSRTTSTPEEESERGRFEGSEIKEQLSTAATEFDSNSCWDFLYERGLKILYADKEKVRAAKAGYRQGAAERREDTVHGSRTLSRGAAELRLQGLLGPVNVLRWKGTHETGHHEPSPAKLVTELSSAGDGWYFFFANVVSFHTLIIAVEVVRSHRKFFVIEAGKAGKDVTEEELNKKFDELDPTRGGRRQRHTSHVGSRIWQVYAKATE